MAGYEYETLLFDKQDTILTITLNRHIILFFTPSGVETAPNKRGSIAGQR